MALGTWLLRGKRLDKISPRWPQLCIPRQYRMLVLSSYHGISHAGFLKCLLTSRLQFFWPAMSTDFKLFCSTCTTCQQIKPMQPQSKIPMVSNDIYPMFYRLHMDHHDLSKLKNCKNPYKYVFIVTCAMSLQTIMEPCITTSAAEAAKIFHDRWVCHYGTPIELVSDWHQSFLSEFMKVLCKLCNIKQCYTSPRKPSTNSCVELRNKCITNYLRLNVKKNF